ncbi:MFS transporter [Rhodococcus sp. APC 3903]|uniref:MFS transporter n=1 Tax=Rhodococcus sp. APC 3903 TaxID=3035193 RepID=UPI0025B3214F|nr:MFS transporter [Rhodococcus sp. APC 3903]MDN3460695.1 MFS transporter [Rhodococcus sp. APC 3903]
MSHALDGQTSTKTVHTSPDQNPNHARRWLVLVIIAATQLMIVLDATIVNIALPQAQADLGISDGSRTWVVTAYALAFGALLLLGGRISDYWGRRKSFLVGMTGFAVASAFGGVAQESWHLFAARAGQGVFAALLAPAALAILTVTFTEPKERAKAFGVFGAIAGGGAAVGLLLGGVLTEYLSWRWCLLVNVPVAVIAVVAAYAVIEESKAEGDTRYDIPGAVVIALGLGSLVYGFTRAETGWGSPSTVAFIGAGVLLIIAFGIIESRTANPLLPLRVLFHRDRGPAFFASMMVGTVLVGATLFLTFYFQIVLQYSPVIAGLASMPITGGIFVTAGVASSLMPRFGPKPLMSVGPLLSAVGLLMLLRIDIDTSYWTHVFPALVLVGLGLGLLIIPLQNVALIGVPDHDAGAASALVNATLQVGGALGAAIFTSVYTSTKQTHLLDNPLASSMEGLFHAEVASYHSVFGIAAVFVAVISPVVFFVVRAKKDDLPDGEVLVHAG